MTLNQTCAACSFEFEIRHMILDQVKPLSVQLTLFILIICLPDIVSIYYVSWSIMGLKGLRHLWN